MTVGLRLLRGGDGGVGVGVDRDDVGIDGGIATRCEDSQEKRDENFEYDEVGIDQMRPVGLRLLAYRAFPRRARYLGGN
jgi:hypothetical protein